MSACGPSRTRSTSSGPSVATATSVASAGSAPPDRHTASMAAGSVASVPRSLANDTDEGIAADPAGCSGSCSPANASATCRAVAADAPAMTTCSASSACPGRWMAAVPSVRTSTTVWQMLGSSAKPSARIRAATEGSDPSTCRVAVLRAASRPGSCTTSSRCAWCPAARPSSARAPDPDRSREPSTAATSGPAPTSPSPVQGAAACGSHRSQRPSGDMTPGGSRPATRRSAGP